MAKSKKGKTSNCEKQPQNPPKPKYTYAHDQLYKNEIAPRYRQLDRVRNTGNYDLVNKLWNEIQELLVEWRILKDRRVRIEK